jgi:SAM-dependent methyltransferase
VADGDGPEPGIDTSVAHAARVYDYMIGGTTNFPADREASHLAGGIMPGGLEAARAGLLANRRFLARAVRFLAGEAGIDQFLDIGSGIPARDNVHEVAQAVVPGARVVYVDNDPIVLAHAGPLLAGSAEGATAFVRADLRGPGRVLAAAGETLDLSRPVAVLLVSVLHFLADDEGPHEVVARLAEAVPPGSWFVVSHLARDVLDLDETYATLNQFTEETFTLRRRDEVARFLDGLEPVEPGLVLVDEWRPEPGHVPVPGALPLYGAVARRR